MEFGIEARDDPQAPDISQNMAHQKLRQLRRIPVGKDSSHESSINVSMVTEYSINAKNSTQALQQNSYTLIYISEFLR